MLTKKEYEQDEHAKKTWETYDIYVKRFCRWNDHMLGNREIEIIKSVPELKKWWEESN